MAMAEADPFVEDSKKDNGHSNGEIRGLSIVSRNEIAEHNRKDEL